jgi:hypothetical protein
MELMVPELELQQDLQRFAMRFVDRITQAAESLQTSPSATVRAEALRKNLLYASSAMEIATGASARVNLLDMFVFLHLSRRVLANHWIPTLYGADGAELDDAFTRAEQEIAGIVVRALGEQGLAQLANIVDSWLADNPGAIRVEGMRLGDFAATAGAAAQDRALQAKGLLSGVKVATDAANQAMVVAERALFLLHRMPFLWRLQMRVGMRDSLDDALVRVKTGDETARLAHFVKRGAVVAILGAATAGVFLVRMARRKA